MTTAPQSPAETYESYFGPTIFQPWARELLDRARPSPGDRVLDLACGTGIVSRLAGPHVTPGGTILGVDASPGMLAVARAKASGEASIELREGDASALDLPGESFDLALCQQGLQFFPDREAAMRGVHRALRPGGRVALSVWRGIDENVMHGALFVAVSRFLGLPVETVARPFMFGDEEALRTLLEETGYEDVSVERVTREVRFPEPDRFVELSTLAASAVMPEQGQADPGPLLDAVNAEIADLIARGRRGDELVTPMSTNIAVAFKRRAG